MKKQSALLTILMSVSMLFLARPLYAVTFSNIPFEFESFTDSDLDDNDASDDNSFGSVPLEFSVNIGGGSYDHFDMNSNGYVQLLSGFQSPTDYGYGGINDLINADTSSTYLLAGYDDLDSSYYGFYGYKQEPNRAIFYFDTETYADGDNEFLNNFEIILNDDGSVQWNFNYADYESYDYDLFSGLYFGNTQTQLELYSGTIPFEESWLYKENQSSGPSIPEPSTLLLLGSSLFALITKRSSHA